MAAVSRGVGLVVSSVLIAVVRQGAGVKSKKAITCCQVMALERHRLRTDSPAREHVDVGTRRQPGVRTDEAAGGSHQENHIIIHRRLGGSRYTRTVRILAAYLKSYWTLVALALILAAINQVF